MTPKTIIGKKIWAECMAVGISEACANGLVTYIEIGLRPGSFLSAVVEGDFFGAALRADPGNAKLLVNYAQILVWYAPSGCYGDSEKVGEWIEKSGLVGA